MSCSVCQGYDSQSCPCCENVYMVICPECKGTGMKKPRAFHIHRRITAECSELCYQILPKDEEDAEYRGENWCRYPREKCPTCNGDGEILENSGRKV